MADENIIDGKAFAADLRARIGETVTQLKVQHDLTPGLAVVLVGADPASQVYVRNKNKATLEAGMQSFEHVLPDTISQEELLSLIERLNSDDGSRHFGAVALPDQIDEQAVIDAINPAKDADGFHVINTGRLATGGDAMVPCTPLGV